MWGPQPPANLRACPCLYRLCFNFEPNLNFSQQTSIKVSNIKFDVNPSIWSRVVHTDRRTVLKLVGASRDLGKSAEDPCRGKLLTCQVFRHAIVNKTYIIY
jgi:hypothetical protein